MVLPISAKAAVKLNKKAITMYSGKTYKLKIKGTKKKPKWSSSNKNIATVTKKGKVKAKKRGTCKIIAKIGSKKYTCKVTVKQLVTKLTLNKKTVTITQGGTYTLKTTIFPTNANNRAVSWSSNNKSIATVSQSGVVKAVKTGTATVSATSNALRHNAMERPKSSTLRYGR